VAQNQILQVAVFASCLVRRRHHGGGQARSLVSVLQSLTETMFRLTRIVMYMAPVAAAPRWLLLWEAWDSRRCCRS